MSNNFVKGEGTMNNAMDYMKKSIFHTTIREDPIKQNPLHPCPACDTCTREREMLIKGKRFIISSVFPLDARTTATDKMLALIDADLQKDAKSF